MPIETALIVAPSRAETPIFRRTLLERLLIICDRVGIRRVLIEAPEERRPEVDRALGRFRDASNVTVVGSFSRHLAQSGDLNQAEPVVAISGNLVFSKSHLARILDEYLANGSHAIHVVSTDPEHGGIIAVGTPAQVSEDGATTFALAQAGALLPFALNGRAADHQQAEFRLALSVREETASKDALLARLIDRRFSWRISYRLARTSISPNQITIANTLLGCLCAWLFSWPDYWVRLAASILFVIATAVDGVDGEVARLKMAETELGGKLDVISDAVISFLLFSGIYAGCYRAGHDPTYAYLFLIFTIGYALCAFASYRVYTANGPAAERWIALANLLTSRDFAYILVIFALFNRMQFVAWGTAFGSYVFAFAMMGMMAYWQRASRKSQENERAS